MKKGQSMQHELVVITPETAVEWLRVNTRNRLLSKSRVATIARDISAGAWNVAETAASPIAFYEDGALANGQHRLSAIVNAGMPVTSWVIRGIPHSVQFDNVRARTFGDNLQIDGYANAKTLASVAWNCIGFLGPSSESDRGRAEPSKAEMRRAIELLDLPTYAHLVSTLKPPFRLAAMGALVALGHLHSPAIANAFFDEYRTGVGLGPTSPVLHLRNRIMNYPVSRLGNGLVFMILAWNAYAQGKPMGILRLSPGMSTANSRSLHLVDMYGVDRQALAALIRGK